MAYNYLQNMTPEKLTKNAFPRAVAHSAFSVAKSVELVCSKAPHTQRVIIRRRPIVFTLAMMLECLHWAYVIELKWLILAFQSPIFQMLCDFVERLLYFCNLTLCTCWLCLQKKKTIPFGGLMQPWIVEHNPCIMQLWCNYKKQSTLSQQCI